MNSKLNILYVEDHETSRQSVANILNFLDFVGSVKTACDGEEALRFFIANKNYDILITDINMPKINGLTLISEIKKHKNIFSIITTAHNDNEYLHNAIENDIDKYLLKPLNMSKLVDTLKDFYNKKIEDFRAEHKKEIDNANSRLNSIKEIINNISHQWRQPLSEISVYSSSLLVYKDHGSLDDEYLKKSLKVISKKTQDLSATLDNLNHILKNSTEFTTKNFLNQTKEIVKKLIDEQHTDNLIIVYDIKDDLELNTLWNDLSLVLKDIMINSIEQINNKKIKNPRLQIQAYIDDQYFIIKIIDNAHGIDEEILPRVFEPYTTTKFKSNGKGLGLYISFKLVTELLNGELFAKNEDDGAIFTIKLKK